MKNVQELEQFKTQLNDKLSQEDLMVLSQHMGYRNIDQFQFRLNKLLKEPYLGLEDGYYDFKMDTITFIQTLCEQLGLDVLKVQALTLSIQENLSAYNEYRPYIFIETDFDIDQNISPLLALTFMETKRQLKVSLDEFCVDCDDMIDIIHKKIVAHYQLQEGAIEHWGDILSYVYFHNPQTQLHFDCRGEVVSHPENLYPYREGAQL